MYPDAVQAASTITVLQTISPVIAALMMTVGGVMFFIALFAIAYNKAMGSSVPGSSHVWSIISVLLAVVGFMALL